MKLKQHLIMVKKLYVKIELLEKYLKSLVIEKSNDWVLENHMLSSKKL